MIKKFLKNLLDLRKDYYSLTLVVIVFFLLVFGFLAISSCTSLIDMDNPSSYFIKHCFNISAGFVIFLIFYSIDYKNYKNHTILFFILMTILLIIPLFCRPIKGAHRWITLPLFSIQPSEFTKIVLTMLMASFLSKYKDYINSWNANVVPAIYIGVFVIIIGIFQKDFGTALLLSIIWFSLLFISKIDTKRIIIIIFVGFILLSILIAIKPYRVNRLITFFNNFSSKNEFIANKNDDAYNSEMSFAAFGSGGIFGKGMGNSELKLNHLPEKHTDYIFAIIGEEYGLFGTLFIVILFMLYIKTILSIYRKCKDDFGKYLSFGIMLIIAIQSIINMGMSVGIIPAKGFPLPFISYGGSSMLSNFCMLGILMNISRNNNNHYEKYTYSR